MTYTESAAAFEHQVRQTKAWVGGNAGLVPGIGATLGQLPDMTLRQILTTRTHDTKGFILFDYNARLADEILPLIRSGLTSD